MTSRNSEPDGTEIFVVVDDADFCLLRRGLAFVGIDLCEDVGDGRVAPGLFLELAVEVYGRRSADGAADRARGLRGLGGEGDWDCNGGKEDREAHRIKMARNAVQQPGNRSNNPTDRSVCTSVPHWPATLHTPFAHRSFVVTNHCGAGIRISGMILRPALQGSRRVKERCPLSSCSLAGHSPGCSRDEKSVRRWSSTLAVKKRATHFASPFP